jgi:Zn finger protein HypA/HybF involved in hydrogenase expression
MRHSFPVGPTNPKYKDGRSYRTICLCGKEKDVRADICLECKIGSREKYFDKNGKIRTILAIDKINLESHIKQSISILEVSKRLGTSRQTITRLVLLYKIDVSHFRPGRNRPTDIDKFLTIGIKIRRGTVKRIVIEHQLIKYECLWCGIGNIWNGVELILELDHINGNPCDNRLENLRFLCPNCHSQTDTNKGKNLRGRNRVLNKTK